MPQTFQVLRCYKCEVFQVHPTKKTNKWKCKLCGVKQSMKRFYGLGTGKECRLHVQKLNGIRGELDDHDNGADTNDLDTGSESPEHSGQDEIPACSIGNNSKWLHYVDPEIKENLKTEEEQVSPGRNMHLNYTEVVLELPKKRPRKCLNVSNKIVNKTEIKCLPEKDSQPAKLLSNYNASNNCIKSVENNNKAGVNTIKTNQPPTHHQPTNLLAPTLANNSKWSKFVEGTQNCHDANDMDPITSTSNQSNSMFPFLEDDDIDSVLDF